MDKVIAKAKNLRGKTRNVENPYEIWASHDGSWEWRVLKVWQADDNKPYARYFCAVRSPFTYGSWEYGDVYVAEVKGNAVQVYSDPEGKAGICPRCGLKQANGTVSRLDNRTIICDCCGLHEALISRTRATNGEVLDTIKGIEELFKKRISKQ